MKPFHPLPLLVAAVLALFPPALLAGSGMNGDSGAGPVRKKLIDRGWGCPSVEEFGANLKAIEASPFDGVAIKFKVKDDDGREVNAFMAGANLPWKQAWFQPGVEALRKIHSDKVRESFFSLSIAINPRQFADAFDDEGWKNIVEHFRIAAWVAKQAGMKGVMADLESYGDTLLKYKSRRTDKSFDEYAAKVRQRGREIMQAMAGEYPGMTVFTLFLNSGPAMGAFGGDPRPMLEPGNSGYNLMPAFLNGWLDAIPPGMTLVDGMEHSYPHSTELAYLRRVNAARNTAIAFVSEKNRAKYRAQVQAGLAIYMDAFLNDRQDVHADVYTDPPLTGSLADRLKEATASALDAVDEYVWVFDEQYRFWPTANKAVKPLYWDEMIPGTTEALKTAKDPAYRMRRRAAEEFAISEHKAGIRGVPLVNLLKEGRFLPAAPGKKTDEPVEVAWTARNSGGTAGRSKLGCADPGSLLLKGTGEGSWSQSVAIKPGLAYQFRARVRQTGKGEPTARLVWMDANGREIGAVAAKPAGSPREAWATMESTVFAPLDAATLTVELSARDQASEGDQVWYDNAEIYRISVN